MKINQKNVKNYKIILLIIYNISQKSIRRLLKTPLKDCLFARSFS